jgi:dihydroorotate dehydrogenase
VARLERHRGLVGANIGINKDSTDRIADFSAGVAAMTGVADYLTVNISSPNTPGLRDLQEAGALDSLLMAITEMRGAGPPIPGVKGPRPSTPPVFLKVAPDLEPAQIDAIARIAIDRKIDALIVANTTLSRPPLRSKHRGEAGGLSGAPLKALALARLRDFRAATGGALPLIAAGGIASGADALERIRAGASLVQLYTALVYRGPGLARKINRELKQLLRQEGFARLTDAIGTEKRS